MFFIDRELSDAERNQVLREQQVRYGTPHTDGVTQKVVETFGDSITSGSGASTAANRWANLYSTAEGLYLVNRGVSGTVMQNTNQTTTGLPRPNNGRDRYASVLTGSARAHKVVILYGVNDGYLGASTEPSMNVADFIVDYQAVIDGLFADGYTTDDIIIGSPPYYTIVSNQVLQQEYADAVRALAVTNGVRYADVRQAMIDGGGATLLTGDNIHPNDAGHAVIATAIAAATFVT